MSTEDMTDAEWAYHKSGGAIHGPMQPVWDAIETAGGYLLIVAMTLTSAFLILKGLAGIFKACVP